MANFKNITDVPVVESAEGLNLIVNDNGAAKQIAASAVGAQADWNVEDVSSPAYILNKPENILTYDVENPPAGVENGVYVGSGGGMLILNVEASGEELLWKDNFPFDEIYTAARAGNLVCHVWYQNGVETGNDSIAVGTLYAIGLPNHNNGRFVSFGWELFEFSWGEDGFSFVYD